MRVGIDHTKLTPEASAKVLKTAIQITEIPELYINSSIKKQLQSQLKGSKTIADSSRGRIALQYILQVTPRLGNKQQ